MHRHLPVQDFEGLQIPFACVATDLGTGELVTLSSGDLPSAIQASSAFPFVFAPVELYGRPLVDGGVVNTLPVTTARALNPHIVIAVDVGYPLPETLPTNLFGVIKRSVEITYARQTTVEAELADIVIRPDLGEMGVFDDSSHERAYEAGRRAAREMIPGIRALSH